MFVPVVASGSGPSRAIAVSSALTVRYLVPPCRQNAQHYPERKEWENEPVLPVPAATHELTPSNPLAFTSRPVQLPDPRRTTHGADVRGVQRRGLLPFDKNAGKVETALRRRGVLPPYRQAENHPGTAIRQGGGRTLVVGRVFLARDP
jgi:hypothetical protein